MLSSVEQAFVGRDEKRAPLKTPAWEANHSSDLLIISDLVPPGLVGDPAHCAPSQVSILRFRLFVTICCFSVFSSHDCT